MTALLFIHGFATGPAVWENQMREFSKDFNALTSLEGQEQSEDLFVVGWSMGGWKAIDLYLEARFKIRGIVFVSAFARYLKTDDYPAGTPAVLLRRLEQKFNKDCKTGTRYFYDMVFKHNNRHKLIDHFPPPGPADIGRWFKKLKEEDRRADLSGIDLPVLILQGDSDPIVSAESARYLRDNIKNSELHMFAGGGHAPFIESPEIFNRHLRRFFAKHGS